MTTVMTANTLFRVGKLVPGAKTPATVALTNTVAGANGSTSLTIAASPIYIEAGRKFTLGGVEITAGSTVLLGATSLPLATALTSTIAINSTAQVAQLFDFIGAESVDLSANLGTISIRNFRSGMWGSDSKTSVSVSMSLEGQFHVVDKAISNVIRPAVFTLGEGTTSPEVYVEFTRPNGDVYSGAFLVMNYSEPTRVDDVLRVSFELTSQGAIVIPAPKSLNA